MQQFFHRRHLPRNNFASAYLGNSARFQEVPNMPERLSGKEIGTPAGECFPPFQIFSRWNNALYGGKILKPKHSISSWLKVQKDVMQSLEKWDMPMESC
jgi:hypothetical protein